VEVRVGDILSRLETAKTPEGTVITLPELVLFDFNQAELKADAATTLAEIAEVVAFYGEAPVSIRGHTDDVGDEAYNDDLSRRRATAVAEELASTHGIDRARLDVVGLGEREPVAPNARADGSDDPEGRQQNRRVEVVIEGVSPPPLE
jgi:photosystem I P700 chlorophyll a apoprotein A2